MTLLTILLVYIIGLILTITLVLLLKDRLRLYKEDAPIVLLATLFWFAAIPLILITYMFNWMEEELRKILK